MYKSRNYLFIVYLQQVDSGNLKHAQYKGANSEPVLNRSRGRLGYPSEQAG